MRKIEFTGVLSTPESFKQYFLLVDSLLALEWRIKVFYSDELPSVFPMLKSYFSSVLICDDVNRDFPSDHAGRMFYNQHSCDVSAFVSQNIFANLGDVLIRNVRGIDEILIPISEWELFEKHKRSNGECPISYMDCLFNEVKIRRMDILIPEATYPHEVGQLSAWASSRDMEFHVVVQHDSPETEWYSRPGIEEVVDADPIPYLEGDLWCSITADTLYHKGGFHLNEQRDPVGDPFYVGDDPLEMIVSMMEAKVEKYRQYADAIQNREGNIYYNYFRWVADHVVVNRNFSFIPNFMLRPDMKFYQELVRNGIMVETPHGLLRTGSAVIPLVGFKNA